MSIAENIKRAALGPTPRRSELRKSWVGLGHEWDEVTDNLGDRVFVARLRWTEMSNDERRMFLLFVAYSLGAK